jgi:hypothetical protein
VSAPVDDDNPLRGRLEQHTCLSLALAQGVLSELALRWLAGAPRRGRRRPAPGRRSPHEGLQQEKRLVLRVSHEWPQAPKGAPECERRQNDGGRWCRASTPPARPSGVAPFRKPATRPPAAGSSRPPGTIDIAPWSAARWRAGARPSPRRSSGRRGGRNSGCIGVTAISSATANDRRSLSPRSPASWWASCGRP